MKKIDIINLFNNIPDDADLMFNVSKVCKEFTMEVTGYHVSLDILYPNGTKKDNFSEFDINLSKSLAKDSSSKTLNILSKS